MSKIINFPRNFYRYDFSVPEILQRDAANDGYMAGSFSDISYYLDDEPINGIFGSHINPLRLDWLDLVDGDLLGGSPVAARGTEKS